MKVYELIAALQAFPPDMRVVVDGYEDDLDEPKIRESFARFDKPREFCGQHREREETAIEGYDPRDAGPVVVVSRYGPGEV